MLVELRLENYAVIDNLAIEFAPGLNLLTGETGAGKSILIDALALLLGDKASPDVIRTGAERALISAVFEVESGAEKIVAQVLESNGIDSDHESIILRREIAASGKGRVSTRDELLQKLWGRRESHRDRTVDVFVRRLREKIDRRASQHTFIQTRYGVGYKLEAVRKDRAPAGSGR